MSNTIRFTGLASGFDTETMIQQLMKAERMKVDTVFQKKVWAEWQRDSYREVNSQLLEFRNLASNMRLQGSFMAKKVTSSNNDVATAKSTGSAANFSYELEVKQLATNGYAKSTESIKVQALDINGDPMMENGEPVMVFNTQSKEFLASAAGLTSENPTKVFTINGKDFTVDNTKSLDSLLKEINSANIGVSAFYDEVSGKVSISSMVPGKGQMQIDDTDGFLADVLKFKDIEDEDGNVTEAWYTAGEDAKFILNGLETSRSSNTFTINGVEFALKAEGTTTVSSATDTDKVFDMIKGFVDKYNELITKTNATLSEKRYRDYPPLTDEQRKDMSESEVKLWEEKAKSGQLRGDSMVSSALSSMRMIMGSAVQGLGEGALATLSSIGIATASYEDGGLLENGFLHIDEEKLREALEEKPQEVIDLFTKQSDDASEQGIATRLYESVNSTISRLTEKAGSSAYKVDNSLMSKEIKRIEDELQRFEDRMLMVEERYWKQFTAMEKALANMQNQGNSIAAMLNPQ